MDELGREVSGGVHDRVISDEVTPFLEGRRVEKDRGGGLAKEGEELCPFPRDLRCDPPRMESLHRLVEKLDPPVLKGVCVGIHSGSCGVGEAETEAPV